MAQLTVRDSCLEDSDEIFCLFKAFAVLDGLADDFKGTIDTFRRDGFGKERRFSCMVAEERLQTGCTKILGFLQYTWIYNAWRGTYTMHIEELSVVENRQRQGIGTALFHRAIKTAAVKGFTRIQLSARKENTPALTFYKKLGAINATSEYHEWNKIKVFRDTIKSKAEQLSKHSELALDVERSQPSPCSEKSLVTARCACVEDCEEIFRLLKELVVFENCADEFSVDIDTFRRDGFGENRRFHCFVVEDLTCSESGRPMLAGFLLYTLVYKILQGYDIMYIEDIFVADKSRRRGIGTALFGKAIQTAAAKGYPYIQLTARKSNTPALNFYGKFDAVNVSEVKGTQFIMFDNIYE